MSSTEQHLTCAPHVLTSGAERRVSRPRITDPMPLYFGLLVFFVALIYAISVAPLALRDPDTFWHVRTGEWILDHKQWPHTDPFSFTFFGQPWMAKEWVSQIVLALLFKAGGWRAIALMAAISYAAIAAIMTVYLTRYLRFSLAIGLALVTFLLLGTHFLARPHLFAYVILALWLLLLLDAYDNSRSPPIWLPGLMLLWANLHSTFVLGLGLFFVVSAFIVFDAIRSGDAPTCRRTVLVAFAVTLAACITPYGWSPLLITWDIMGMKAMMANLTEWLPPNFRNYPPRLVYLLAVFTVLSAFGIQLRGPRLVLLMIAVWLGFSYSRGFIIFMLLFPFVLARPAAQQVAYFARLDVEVAERVDPVLRFLHKHARLLAIGCVGLATFALVLSWQEQTIEPADTVAPRAAMNFVDQANISGRVFNSYNFGGYLIFANVPTFIDGRAEFYGDAFVERYFATVELKNIRESFHLFDQYKIDWALLRPVEPLTNALANSDAWSMVYSDAEAVVFVRVRN